MTIGRALSCYATLGVALTCSILVLAKPPDKDKDKNKDKDKENYSEVTFTARTELVLIPTLVAVSVAPRKMCA